MAEPQETGAELIQSEDLVRELLKRYPRALIILEDHVKTGEDWETNYHINGGYTIALGLTERLRLWLLSEYSKQQPSE